VPSFLLSLFFESKVLSFRWQFGSAGGKLGNSAASNVQCTTRMQRTRLSGGGGTLRGAWARRAKPNWLPVGLGLFAWWRLACRLDWLEWDWGPGPLALRPASARLGPADLTCRVAERGRRQTQDAGLKIAPTYHSETSFRLPPLICNHQVTYQLDMNRGDSCTLIT